MGQFDYQMGQFDGLRVASFRQKYTSSLRTKRVRQPQPGVETGSDR